MKLFSAILMVMAATAMAQDADIPEVDPSNDMHQDGTDDDVAAKAAEDSLDGFSADEVNALRESAETMEFQAEVNRMMKLIINSLYKNKVCNNINYYIWLYYGAGHNGQGQLCNILGHFPPWIDLKCFRCSW